MRLLLIRHGETDSNVQHLLDTAAPGAPLNEQGRRQAEALAIRLADVPLDAIYASPLIRAQQTAAPVAAAKGLTVRTIPGLREIPAGVEEMNADWTEYLRVLNSWAPDNLDVALEGGETCREFLQRYFEAFEAIEADGFSLVAAVSHGAAIRVAGLSLRPGLSQDEAPPLLNTQWLEIEGSSARGWHLSRWADRLLDEPTDP